MTLVEAAGVLRAYQDLTRFIASTLLGLGYDHTWSITETQIIRGTDETPGGLQLSMVKKGNPIEYAEVTLTGDDFDSVEAEV